MGETLLDILQDLKPPSIIPNLRYRLDGVIGDFGLFNVSNIVCNHKEGSICFEVEVVTEMVIALDQCYIVDNSSMYSFCNPSKPHGFAYYFNQSDIFDIDVDSEADDAKLRYTIYMSKGLLSSVMPEVVYMNNDGSWDV